MPKKPNSEIRAALLDIADTLRDLTALLDEPSDALHNARLTEMLADRTDELIRLRRLVGDDA